MSYIDTHVHLYDESFSNDIDQVIDRAVSNGVTKVILPGIDSESHEAMMDFAKRYEGFAYPAIGLHPTSVKENWKEELKFIEDNIDSVTFCAVGEIGIDGYWSKEFLKEQKFVFKRQIELALERDLPIIIHLRDSTDEIFETLEEVYNSSIKGLKGVFHAYSGSFETYQRIKKYGDFKVGIGGVVTFKNAHIAKVIENIPIEDILLETDAPWLTPAPFRGQRNESSYLIYIAEKISQIKNIPIGEIGDITTDNAVKLFKI